MSLISKILGIFWLVMLLPTTVIAETAYVIDQIQVGIHASSNLDSPILKLVGTGAQLTIKQRGVDMSEVEDPDGTKGWINTAYLVDNKPGGDANNNSDVSELQTQLQQAQTEIKKLRNDLAQSNSLQETEELTTLRLKIGELQAKLTEERKKNTQASPAVDNAAIADLVEKNAALEQTVNDLEQQLVLSEQRNTPSIATPLKQHWLTLLLSLVIGMIVGIFFYDLYKRHQHGGFRV